MRKLVLPVLMSALVLLDACAPKTVPVPLATTPKFPDFMRPVVPSSFANSAASELEERGWTYLQAGDLKSASREFLTALMTTPAFYPAEIALGWVDLAGKDPKAALVHFERALDRHQTDTSALVGRGQASLLLNREPDALAAFEAAVAADPSLVDLVGRIEVLRFRGLEQNLTNARAAARAGRLDEAVRAYTTAIASSPETSFLYRELAVVERQKGDVDQALDHFRKAVALDASDAGSLVQVGELLEARGDLDGAMKAYRDALAIEPNSAVDEKLDAVRTRASLARLPAEYRAIDEEAQLTRGDLAALIGIRLASLLQADRRRDAVVVTDVRTHWAATWIMVVTRAGIMDAYANHTFQPRTAVRRVDLAQAVGRLLPRIAASNPSRAKAWETARGRFPDLSAGHIAYPAASAAVAAGVMATGANGSFQPSKIVTGMEAIAAIQRLEALANLPSAPAKDQR